MIFSVLFDNKFYSHRPSSIPGRRVHFGGGIRRKKSQLPATIQQAEVTAAPRALNVVPTLIADLGEEAAWRHVEFFTANIRNPTK